MTLHGNITNNGFRSHFVTLKISCGKLLSLHVSLTLAFDNNCHDVKGQSRLTTLCR